MIGVLLTLVALNCLGDVQNIDTIIPDLSVPLTCSKAETNGFLKHFALNSKQKSTPPKPAKSPAQTEHETFELKTLGQKYHLNIEDFYVIEIK